MLIKKSCVISGFAVVAVGVAVGTGCALENDSKNASASDNAPAITAKTEEIKLYSDEELDISEFEIKVVDSEDGTLKESDTLEPGAYVVTSTYIPNIVGSFEVYVEAMDSDGNIAKDVLFVKTKERVTESVVPDVSKLVEEVTKGEKK